MNVPYTTTHELEFLSNLGTGKYCRRPTSRLELLRNYKALMLGRRWDLVNFEKILIHVEQLIEGEENG